MNEKSYLIIEAIKKESGINPIQMFKNVAKNSFVNIHGPEHHILDGACILQSFYNAGGKIDIEQALEKIAQEGERMPGAMCGLWGVCGAVSSVGAALAIIDGTGPLSSDGNWGEHMKFTSAAIQTLGEVNGPRCCKRDGMISLLTAIEYINTHYPVSLETEKPECEFYPRNKQCITRRCPFFPGK